MEEENNVVVCFGSRNGRINHVRVRGLTADQEDELFVAVEEVYRTRLMTDYLLTCEFWVPDFPLEEVCIVVRAKLREMQILQQFEESVSI